MKRLTKHQKLIKAKKKETENKLSTGTAGKNQFRMLDFESSKEPRKLHSEV
ncbi:hypothetical protein [Moorena producens]|uniref:hypothetical protein n=1 Tax=Moorena producens TaxID=1155739 RepID=UPI003C732907